MSEVNFLSDMLTQRVVTVSTLNISPDRTHFKLVLWDVDIDGGIFISDENFSFLYSRVYFNEERNLFFFIKALQRLLTYKFYKTYSPSGSEFNTNVSMFSFISYSVSFRGNRTVCSKHLRQSSSFGLRGHS